MPRRLTLVCHAAFALALVAVWVMRFVEGLRGVAPFYDDTFYYLLPARRFLETGMFTFDGVNPTNGFHPLWMFSVTFAYWVATLVSDADVYMAMVVWQLVLFTAACVFVYRRFWQHNASGDPLRLAWLGALVLLLVPLTNRAFFMGCGSMLVLPLACLYVHYLFRGELLKLSVVAVVLFVARLDLLMYVIAPTALFLLWETRSPRRVALFVLGPAAAFVVLSLVNYLTVGDIRTISAALKTKFPVPTPRLSTLWDDIAMVTGGHLPWHSLLRPNVVNMTALLLALPFVPRLVRLRSADDRHALLLLCFAAMHVVFWVCFSSWNRAVEPWYVATPSLFLAMALGLRAAGFSTALLDRSRLPLLAAAAFLVCVPYYGLKTVRLAGLPEEQANRAIPVTAVHGRRLIEWMRTTPEGTRFANTDSGILGYYSGRQVTNLDGLMNNYEYQKAMVRPGGLARYLEEQQIDYLIAMVTDRQAQDWKDGIRMFDYAVHPEVYAAVLNGEPYDDFPYYIFSHLYGKHTDPIHFSSDDEAWRYVNAESHQAVLVFALRP